MYTKEQKAKLKKHLPDGWLTLTSLFFCVNTTYVQDVFKGKRKDAAIMAYIVLLAEQHSHVCKMTDAEMFSRLERLS